MNCEECDKQLGFGIDGACVCGKTLCYECFVEKHRGKCEQPLPDPPKEEG